MLCFNIIVLFALIPLFINQFHGLMQPTFLEPPKDRSCLRGVHSPADETDKKECPCNEREAKKGAADGVQENRNHEGQFSPEMERRKDDPEEGVLCAESGNPKINPNSTRVTPQAQRSTAQRNQGRTLRNQQIPRSSFPPPLLLRISFSRRAS